MSEGGKLFFESPYKCKQTSKSQYNEMVNKGWIFSTGDGRVTYNKKFNDIMKKIDDSILTWAIKDGATEMYYPDFYHITDLSNCNYIEQFYPHCFLVGTNDNVTYNQYDINASGFVNNPAVCMHSYIQHRNSIIQEEAPIVITAKGKCKRNEHKAYNTLERLLDFTMREIIFIGSKEFVLNKREQYMEKAKQFMLDMQLEGNICISNDPFFKKEDKVKAEFQRKFKLKYEMNLKIPYDDKMIAVGSFNYHNINFSKAYNMKQPSGQYVHTACVAFGIERFAYACIEQFGLEHVKKILE